MKVDLERHFMVLQTQFATVSPHMLKYAYLGKGAQQDAEHEALNVRPQTLLGAFDEYLAAFKIKVDIGKRAGDTLKHWKSTRKKLENFIRYKYKKGDFELQHLKYSFAESFYNYLTLEVDYPLSENTAKTHVKKTKQVITRCVENELLSRNPLQRFSCAENVKDVEPLELYEIEAMYLKKLSIKRLEEVRDIFIVQCFTGFAFNDFRALSKENIRRVGANGELWLIKERGKTKVNEMVPMLPIVTEILKKYENDPYCKTNNCLLPVNSNTKYNGYLKELADICEITRELKTHLARHTFADVMLNNGAPLEDVQRMLGHKSIRTTQRYAMVRKQRISVNMRKVKTALFTASGKLKKVA